MWPYRLVVEYLLQVCVFFLYVCTLSMTYSVTQEGPDVASMPTHDQPFESQICVYYPVTLCFHHYRVISLKLKDRPTLQTPQFFFHQETQSQLNYWQLSVLDMLGISPWLILWSQQFSDSTYVWFSNIEPLHSCRKHMHAMCVQLCAILKCQLHILLVDMGRLFIPVN